MTQGRSILGRRKSKAKTIVYECAWPFCTSKETSEISQGNKVTEAKRRYAMVRCLCNVVLELLKT